MSPAKAWRKSQNERRVDHSKCTKPRTQFSWETKTGATGKQVGWGECEVERRRRPTHTVLWHHALPSVSPRGPIIIICEGPCGETGSGLRAGEEKTQSPVEKLHFFPGLALLYYYRLAT